jgi:biotin operon repressor
MPRRSSTAATATNPISDRTFGIEIEFVGISIEQALRALENAGIPVNRRLSNGYNHTRTDQWKIVTDSSVDINCYGGGEVVSPILSGEAGIEQARKVAKALDNAGATANRACGLHVHVDGHDFTAPEVNNLAKRYALFEPEIDQIMPRSRRADSNRYCQSFKRWFESVYVSRRFDRATTIAEACGVQDDRFYKLNLCAFGRHGTFEFRQHSGTVNAGKIENWIRFCVNFVETSKAVSVGRRRNPASSTRGRNGKQLAAMHKIVNALRDAGFTGVTPERLMSLTGLSEGSVNVYISKLRTVYGFSIRKRRNRGFVLDRNGELPALAGSASVNTRDTAVSRLAGTVAAVANDSAFRGLPQSVVNFYNERREDLA